MSRNLGTIGSISSYGGQKYDTFHWSIRRFSSLTKYSDECYSSPSFYIRGSKSYMIFYPNGKSPHSEGFFTIHFFSPDYDFTNYMYLKLGIKTRSGRIEKWFCRNIEYPESNGLGLEDIIYRSTFLKRKSELAPSDCLTFVLFLSSNAPKIIKEFSNVLVQTEPESIEENDDRETSEKKSGEKVVEDLGKLLASGDKSDVVIHVEDTEFKAHGCILSARTPVFSALFEHETVEKTSRKVVIKDCEAPIFKEFLNHIYTGKVQNLNHKTVFGLYRIADKYLVDDLKELCRKHVLDTLSIDSFCGAVELALQYEEHDLLQSAIDYFAEHFKVIIKSVEWQRYIEENPREANEIFIKALASS